MCDCWMRIGIGHDTLCTQREDWRAYDAAAQWCAERGLLGKVGDPLPNLMSSTSVDLINADPEAFEKRVRQCAYALAMERLMD